MPSARRLHLALVCRRVITRFHKHTQRPPAPLPGVTWSAGMSTQATRPIAAQVVVATIRGEVAQVRGGMGGGGVAHEDSRYLHIHHQDTNPEASSELTAFLRLETTVRTITTQLSSLGRSRSKRTRAGLFSSPQRRRSPGTHSPGHGHARSRSYPGHSPSSWVGIRSTFSR